MMSTVRTKPVMSLLLSLSILLSGFYSLAVQASMVSTQSAINQQQVNYQKSELISALQSQQVKDQLLGMGVDPSLVEERVASLTPDEITQLNNQLNDMPAGQGVLGALITIFIVFIVTDMLCATDIFSFVKCINR